MEKGTGKRKPSLKQHLWRTVAITALATTIYYVPTLLVMAGRITTDSTLYSLHNFFEIDLFAMVFFAPVAYAAYTVGVKWALSTALVCMLLLFPYAFTRGSWVAVLQPTAFAIILAAVGAAISLLQRSDEHHRQRISELECLSDVGKAAVESETVDSFLGSVLRTVQDSMPEGTGIRITFRDRQFEGGAMTRVDSAASADLVLGEEKAGKLDIWVPHRLRGKQAFAAALAGRISGAVREIELQQSLDRYYQELEEVIERRTRELEEVQEKLIRSERLAAVGELASAVSHELRNPLNVIKNCVYLLNMSYEDAGAADEEVTNTLKMINQQVNISNRIVTDLLDFTRSRSPSVAGTDLSVLVEQSLSWVTVPPAIAVTRSLRANGCRVLVDADQIGRALANILSNAVQAIVGAGIVRISSAIEGDFARVTVEDTGCGIPGENLNRIFEPLFTTKPSGTGLGLAITKKLVEQNGGTIEVKSEVGKGTSFCIRLPLEREEIVYHGESAERARS